MNTFNIDAFFSELAALDVKPHDTVLINLSLEKFGLVTGFKRADYVNIFKQYFAQGGGTFVALAFTRPKFSVLNRRLPFFDGTQPAYTGAFANAMLKDKKSYRSQHPTNSVVAIGPNAKHIVSGLDENAGAYEFARRVIEMKGKILLMGMSDYPGFVTHLVEQDLKLYRQYWHRFFLKVQVKDKVFTRMDPGGCSSTFGRLYPEYIKQEVLNIGWVRGAYTLSIDARKAYEIDYQVVSQNPKILICDSLDCAACRVFRWKKIWWLPFFILRKIVKKI